MNRRSRRAIQAIAKKEGRITAPAPDPRQAAGEALQLIELQHRGASVPQPVTRVDVFVQMLEPRKHVSGDLDAEPDP